MQAMLEHSNVKVDDVTVLHRAAVGDAVTDDLVRRDADRFGEVPVVQRRRVRAALHGRRMQDAVDLVASDTHPQEPARHVHDCAPDPARVSHLLDLLRVHAHDAPLGPRAHAVARRLLAPWDPVIEVICQFHGRGCPPTGACGVH